MKNLLHAVIFALLASVALAANPSVYTNAALTATAVSASTKTGGSTSLLSYNISNANSSFVYIQMFNAASAGAVTLGTTPPTFWLAVPAVGVTDGPLVNPVVFPLGLVIAVTTTPTGSTAPSTSVQIVLVYQ